MFQLNLKIAWRNLLKHKGYAAVNIIGLALGLAGFIFMVLFVNHEKSYDTWDKELANIYQAQEYSDYFSSDKKAHLRSDIDLRLSKIFANNLPGVKGVTMIEKEWSTKKGVTVAGKAAFLQSGIRRSDSLFFRVVPFKFKYGNPESALSKPNSIVLKEAVAEKYFGNVNPVGKIIHMAAANWDDAEDPITVTGVVYEPETPSSINFQAIIFEGSNYFNTSDNEYGSPVEIYVKTEPIKDLNAVNARIQQSYLPVKDRYLKADKSSVKEKIKEGDSPVLTLKNLKDVHQEPVNGNGWWENIKPVMLLSILLLVVSIINFINLATAQASGRAKEIGVKKVIGAYRKSLVMQFLTETFIQCLIAMFIAMFIIEISLPALNGFFNINLSLFNQPSVLLIITELLLIVFVAALLTGFYPAIFLSSYKPQEVLKGNFSNGKNGSGMRKILVGVQFVVSVSFIIGILLVNYQLRYLKNRDNGFTASGLLNVRQQIEDNDKNYRKLKRIDGVQNVAFISGVIGDNATSAKNYKYKGEEIELNGAGMGIEGMQAMDARVIAGRLFSRDVVNDTINNVIINQSAARLFDGNMVGKNLMSNDTTRLTVIGVIKDIQLEGFESATKPMIYVVQTRKNKAGVGYSVKPTSIIRYDIAKSKHVLAEISKTYQEINQYYPASYTFVTDDLGAVLANHERFERMVALFSFLSLSLSLFGLFALAAFITKQRTKEIAVRKVLGAENTSIMVLLNKGYVWIVLIANIIAFPLTYILINKWLSTFAYRIAISPTPFIIAFVASMVITIVTVTLQARKAVSANPVKALKYE